MKNEDKDMLTIPTKCHGKNIKRMKHIKTHFFMS